MKEIVGCIALRAFNSDIFLYFFGSIKSLNRETTIQNNQFSKNRWWISWFYKACKGTEWSEHAVKKIDVTWNSAYNPFNQSYSICLFHC